MSPSAGSALSILSAGSIHKPRASRSGIRVVITGKGGVGKTTLTALLAHLFAAQDFKVLAVDGDPQQNLAITLGIPVHEGERIVPVSESTDYIREKTGAGPGLSPGGLITLNPDVSDVINRFSIPVVNNLRLLVMGGVCRAGSGCLCPEYSLLAAIFRQMKLLPDEVILLDTPAGLEHFGRAVAEGFACAVVLADPSYNALTVARESAALAHQLGIEQVILVVNRVGEQMDEHHVREKAGDLQDFSRVILLPFDPEVIQTEPAVVSLLLQDSAFIHEVGSLASLITDRSKTRASRFS